MPSGVGACHRRHAEALQSVSDLARHVDHRCSRVGQRIDVGIHAHRHAGHFTAAGGDRLYQLRDRAFKFLDEGFDLAETEDQETLGLAGGIFKRKWETDRLRQAPRTNPLQCACMGAIAPA